MVGTRTPDLPQASHVDEFIANSDPGTGMQTARVPVAVVAAQLAVNGMIFNSWSDLSATVGFYQGRRAEVSGDTGTHVDPVTGLTVQNSGVFSWSTSPAGWKFIYSNSNSGQANISEIVSKLVNGAPITVTFYGDSITYGLDATNTTTLPPINGSVFNRSVHPIPETFGQQMAFATGSSVTVRNKGFPGDSSAEGVSRWASDVPGDVAFFMYGHNDANNYGGNGVKTVAQYRANMRTMIDRALAAGAVPVIMAGPHVMASNDVAINPYRSAARELAASYGCLFIDTQEILSTMDPTLYWNSQATDSVHLSPTANNEVGCQIAAIFCAKGNTIPAVAPGRTFDMTGHVFQFSGGIQVSDANSLSGQLLKLSPGNVASFGVYVEEPCAPLITTINSSAGVSRDLNIYYSFAIEDAPVLIANDGNTSARRRVRSRVLGRGYRMIVIRNDGSNDAYLDRVEFVSPSEPASSPMYFHSRSSLAGMSHPVDATGDWAVGDYGRLLKSGNIVLSARLYLDGSKFCGLSLLKDQKQSFFGILTSDQIMFARSGTSLVVRTIVSTVATDYTTPSIFTSGDIEAFIDVVITSSSAMVYVDKVLKYTLSSPPFSSGYPGLFVVGGSANFACSAFSTSDQY